MKKKIATLTLGALGALGLASACSVDMMDAPQGEEVSETAEALVCTNHNAVHSVMSALAVTIGDAMKGWRPQSPSRPGDFYYNGDTIVLTSAGNSRCNANAAKCNILKSTLELFKWENNGVVIGGQPLDVGVLKSRMYAAYDRQVVCMERPNNGRADDCPVEPHELKFWKTEAPETSCANDVWYHAYKPGTTTKLARPDQLANMLIWAGWGPGEYNPWIGFVAVNGDVKIDPLPGMTDGVPAEQSGGAYLVPYNYSVTPSYGYVESFQGVNLTNYPCKANPNYCVFGTYCPTSIIKYLVKRPFSVSKYDCKKDTPY